MQENSEQGNPTHNTPAAEGSPESGSEPRHPRSERHFSGRSCLDKKGPRRQNSDRNDHPRNNQSRVTPPELTPMPPKSESRMNHGMGRRNQNDREPPKHPDGRLIRQPFDGQAHLYEVIQVRLSRTQRLVEVNTNALRLGPNTPVLIRVHRNILLASTVGYRYRRVAEINSLPFVIRVASDEDRLIDVENAIIERHAQELASNYAIEQNLQMKVLSADLSHDHKNITINFASDVRVDFREMVAYLAGQLKLRVEMYQLGLRNGTGIICGLGACGQLLCCGRFLGQFDPIAVKQLRAQGLATNPKRISGVCGRLYCCMSYEYCDYMKERRSLPKKGRKIFSQWGIGRVTDIDMLREEVVVTYENGESQRLTPHDFVPATDEIQARVDAEELVFPLEPAKFYLNHDPSAAAEEGQTKTSTRPAQTRRPESAPRRNTKVVDSATLRENRPSRDSRPVQAEKTGADKAVHGSKHRRPIPAKRHVQETPAAGSSEPREAAMTPVRVRRVRTEISTHPAQPQASQTSASSVPAAPNAEIAQGPRLPRKVKARQANLEEAGNSENRRDPNKTSRRRYSPLNNNNAPKPEH